MVSGSGSFPKSSAHGSRGVPRCLALEEKNINSGRIPSSLKTLHWVITSVNMYIALLLTVCS